MKLLFSCFWENPGHPSTLIIHLHKLNIQNYAADRASNRNKHFWCVKLVFVSTLIRNLLTSDSKFKLTRDSKETNKLWDIFCCCFLKFHWPASSRKRRALDWTMQGNFPWCVSFGLLTVMQLDFWLLFVFCAICWPWTEVEIVRPLRAIKRWFLQMTLVQCNRQ